MNKTCIPAIFFVITLAVFHYLGNQFYLYVKISWYDVFMHIWGGIGIALFIYWFIITYFKKNRGEISPMTSDYFLTVVIVTLIIGIVWEGMETYYDIAGAPVGTVDYYIDTLKDLFNDTLGSVIAYLFLRE